MSSRADRAWVAWALAPVIIGTLVLYQVALLGIALLSLTDYHGTSTTRWSGLGNFRRVLESDDFYVATWNTVKLVLIVVPPTIALSVFLAVMLDGVVRGRDWYRLAMVVPIAATPTAAGGIWRFLYRPDGLINELLGYVGIGPVPWLTSASVALWSIALMSIWQYCGFFVIITLAALQRVPQSLQEAARLDGAGPFARFRHVTLPVLGPVIGFNVVMASVMVSLALASVVTVLPNGGPQSSSQTLTVQLERQVFESAQPARGAALAVVMIFVVASLAGGLFSVSRWMTPSGTTDE